MLENLARAFSGIGLMECGPSIEPGLSGSGLGPFQLYRIGRNYKLAGFELCRARVELELKKIRLSSLDFSKLLCIR